MPKPQRGKGKGKGDAGKGGDAQMAELSWGPPLGQVQMNDYWCPWGGDLCFISDDCGSEPSKESSRSSLHAAPCGKGDGPKNEWQMVGTKKKSANMKVHKRERASSHHKKFSALKSETIDEGNEDSDSREKEPNIAQDEHKNGEKPIEEEWEKLNAMKSRRRRDKEIAYRKAVATQANVNMIPRNMISISSWHRQCTKEWQGSA